ncbi:unnamed protein product [Trifolium pratense]|uniref:Uncharacterized protein n=1 Tax=Trifolium pratense TaxID=57577 RepID=A0ACB0LH02_TRIPR|nr:unnamed protein product [Trifolium pratense]
MLLLVDEKDKPMLFQVGKWICRLKYDNVQRLLEQVLTWMRRNKFYWDTCILSYVNVF